MKPVRTLVVEDSLSVRRRICEVLAEDPQIEIVGEADNGRSAIEMCAALRPNVVTLDMMLPVMSGLAATEYIMAHCPTPILIVSASTNRGELFKTYEALVAGALDVLDKPQGDEPGGHWERTLIGKVKLLARVPVITHVRGRRPVPLEFPRALPAPSSPCQLVAIGASTGGPAAILAVLRALPENFAIPIVVLIHIGAPFAAAFADWLDGQTPHRVRFAADGSRIEPGIRLAPPGAHLVVRGGRYQLTDAPERHSVRPSVDVLFESVAREYGAAGAACLLTGMGKDGAQGLLCIRQSGGVTMAQDEATCVVYGMPREAVLKGAAMRVLPLGEMGRAIANLAGPHRHSGNSPAVDIAAIRTLR